MRIKANNSIVQIDARTANDYQAALIVAAKMCDGSGGDLVIVETESYLSTGGVIVMSATDGLYQRQEWLDLYAIAKTKGSS